MKINKNLMKNKKSLENQENCTLIKHFIKELIRTISPAFSGNLTGSANEVYGVERNVSLLIAVALKEEEGVWGRRGGVFIFLDRRVGG